MPVPTNRISIIGPQAKLLMAPFTASILSTKLVDCGSASTATAGSASVAVCSAHAQPAMQESASKSTIASVSMLLCFMVCSFRLVSLVSSRQGAKKAPRPQ